MILQKRPALPRDKQAKPGKLLRFRLPAAGGLMLLLFAVAALMAEHFISSPYIREKIRQSVAAGTGIEISYRQIGLDYFPSPVLHLRQLTFTIPGQLQGKADALRISPRIKALLTGESGLGTVELERPEVHLELAALPPLTESGVAVTAPGVNAGQAHIVKRLLQTVPALRVRSIDGRFSLTSGNRKLLGEHLNLLLDGQVENPQSGSLSLRMDLAELRFIQGERQETVAGLQLQAEILMAEGDLSWRLQRLAAVKPALILDGTYTDLPKGSGVTLQLNGTAIDVDATRGIALALAGEITPVKEIFTYLGGGTIPEITFLAQGKTLADLGNMNNIHIKGQLQHGVVSVPEVELDLTDVSGEVTLADGILGGTNLEARLGNSAGHSGLFRIGLAGYTDLFQLELMLEADLLQTQKIVQRLLHHPTIAGQLDHIGNLTGRGIGKLVLGDTLRDLKVRVEEADISLSLDYQGVPFPINITTGRLNYGGQQITLQALAGTVGTSGFSGLDVTLNWKDGIHLDLGAEGVKPAVAELYPWLNSMPKVKAILGGFSDISGGLVLSSLSVFGDMNARSQWRYSTAGRVNNLSFTSKRFPGPVRLVQGGFQLDREQLTLENIEAVGLDARLRLTGAISGFAAKTRPAVELSIDGTMDKEAVAWLWKSIDIHDNYAIRTPVALEGVEISWQPEPALRLSGGISVKDGPRLDLDLQHRPEGLLVRKLAVRDQHSDANITFSSLQDNPALSFSGGLRSETLAGLFVETGFGKGGITGELSLLLPGKAEKGTLATGRLQGSDLNIPLNDGSSLIVGRLLLEAEGSRLNADAAALSYHGFVIDPLRAVVELSPREITATVNQAGFCGVDSPGVVKIAGKTINLSFELKGKYLDILDSYSCLTKGRVKMTGKMDIAGRIKAGGEEMAELLGSMEGPLDITFTNGVIEQDKPLATLLKVLNVTEIVKGRLPDMDAAGFKYTLITVDGQFRDGKLHIKKLFMDGETLDILGYGEIDLEEESVKMELLAAPFKTVDTVIKHIPGVNYLLGGSLVAIPVSVEGKLADPRVKVMSPSSVSKSLLNLGARTINLPLKLIESIIPGGK